MQSKTHTAIAALLALGLAGGAGATGLGVDANANADINAGTGGVGADIGAQADATTDSSGSLGADVGVGADADVAETESTDMEETEDTFAENANGVANFGQLVSDLRSDETLGSDLAGFSADSDVTFMTVSDLQGSDNGERTALDNALADRQSDLDAMHGEISANADMMAALEAEGYAAEDVIAVYGDAESDLTVVVHDRM